MRDFTLLPDGRIIVVVTQYAAGGSIIMVRGYTANGQADSTFGTNGSTSFSSTDGRAEGRRIQSGPDGKIVVLAATKSPTLIARMNSNGIPDSSFGSGGVAYGWGVDFAYLITNSDLITDGFGDILIQPDGKIVYGLNGDWSDSYFVARQNADGTIDGGFGIGGYATVNVDSSIFYGDTISFGLSMLPNGQFVVSGATIGWGFGPSSTGVSRLNSNGTIDPTFGKNGKLVIESRPADFRGAAAALNVLSGGAILLGGVTDSKFSITRLNENGSIDPSFGARGVTTTPIGEPSRITSILGMVTQPDGKVLAVGVTRSENVAFISMARYLNDPAQTLVSVSGRVMTPDGNGLRNAAVTLTDTQGVVRTTTTGSFGFYSFDNVQTGSSYTLAVSSRRYRYASRTLQVDNSLSNIDFIGLE